MVLSFASLCALLAPAQCCDSVASSASPQRGGLASCCMHRAVPWSWVPTTHFLCSHHTKWFLLPVPFPSPWFMLMWANLLDTPQCVTKRAWKFPEMFSTFMDIIKRVHLFLYVQINLDFSWSDMISLFTSCVGFLLLRCSDMRCLFLWQSNTHLKICLHVVLVWKAG